MNDINQVLEQLLATDFSHDGSGRFPVASIVERDYGLVIQISAEEGDGVADYWGEIWECGYVNEKIEAFAKELGGFWEWENAGILHLADVEFTK